MNQSTESNESMKRGEFIRSLGLNSAALMAFYCMGTSLTACSKSNSDPTPGTGTGTGSGSASSGGSATIASGNADLTKGTINFVIDLSNSANSPLNTAGGYLYAGSIVVAQVKGGTYVALAKACTHQGTSIEYQLSPDNFYCPNHGSRFSDAGAVLNGPAVVAVTQYKTALNGTKLTIMA